MLELQKAHRQRNRMRTPSTGEELPETIFRMIFGYDARPPSIGTGV